MPSTSVILLDYVCPALGSIIATSMFAGKPALNIILLKKRDFALLFM